MNTLSCPRPLLSCLGLLCAMGSFFPASAAVAADEPVLLHVRVCDSSACYRAWNVVDSDNDGYADADEAAAGTDPFDATSTPSLEVILDLIGLELLPTFEFGVGELLVFPAEFQEMLAKAENEAFPSDLLTVFPLGERKDSLKRAGIDSDLLAAHGLDAEFGGFTFTLGNEPNDAGPPRRVGGADVRLVGNYVDPESTNDAGNIVFSIEYGDGEVTHHLDTGVTVRFSIEKWSPTGYTNPDSDSDYGGVPTKEALEAWERIRNAVAHTIEGWAKDMGSPDDVFDKNKTIILIDPDYIEMMGQISGPPRINKAQPETKPDLFNPLAPGGVCSSC